MNPFFSKDKQFEEKDNQCFLIMPFSESWSDIVGAHIKKIVEKQRMICKRGDDVYGRNVLEDIWSNIRESRIIIADITARNPNVLYELGLAHAMYKDVIILSQDVEDIPYDLQPFRCIIYDNNPSGFTQLEEEIAFSIEEIFSRDLVDNFGRKIKKSDTLLLYLSDGGTCRCAIANAITRFELQNTEYDIVPMSAALFRRSKEFATPNAQKVVKNHLKLPMENHKTVKASFELKERADLILAMSDKIYDGIDDEFKEKSILFTEFFGGNGGIEDPYMLSFEKYEECFQEIRNLISPNMDKILELCPDENTGIISHNKKV
ncbi:hypothetical protein [uncultured Methanobacterium sp.]|uniref:arsenate reductase/protein-tyrosine-phosphatase family protein n=1 Tax=uncultured Methanobacterium sp. TaxID=176306 RepID=UPI002AA76FBD|nr:hypothetical protein [uncultured Methanobacterium sp.]